MGRPTVLKLSPFLHENPKNFAEMRESCRKMVEVWEKAGGDPSHDGVPILDFVLLGRACDSFLNESARGAANLDDYFESMNECFRGAMEEVRHSIETYPTISNLAIWAFHLLQAVTMSWLSGFVTKPKSRSFE